jgi:hypothetical protein
MSMRRILVIAMSVLLAGLPAAAAAQSQSVVGSIAGSLDAGTPNTGQYSVRLRDAVSGQVVRSAPLGPQGQFSFTQLPLGHKYLVELYDTSLGRVVSTQGPFTLSTATSLVRTGVTLSTVASRVPAAMWLLAAGAGTASAVTVATQSASR